MHTEIKRRRFGQLALFTTLLTFVSNRFKAAVGPSPPPPSHTMSAKGASVSLNINGVQQSVDIEPRVTLLDVLRERIGLTGTKKGCNHGQCGACTVAADGRRINSCLALAVPYEGAEITTIEGIADGEDLHPMQAAFINNDGLVMHQ